MKAPLRHCAAALLCAWSSVVGGQSRATPIISASTQAQLDPAIPWVEGITSKVYAANRHDRAALESIVASLYEWARLDAFSQITGDARSIYPRRVSGAVMAWRVVRWQAKSDWRTPVIDRWIYATGKRMRTLFGLGGGISGVVLNYNNNLQATAAMVAYAAGLLNDDSTLRYWAILSAEEVLNEVDSAGFTIEIYRSNPEKAEYYSHETMIYLMAIAQMSSHIGNTELWSYAGAKASGSHEPALVRAGRLLNADLGTSVRYSTKTGRKQITYPNGKYVGSLFVPSGYIACWFKPFLNRYGADNYLTLSRVDSTYDLVPEQRYNSGLGGWMP